MEKTDKAVSTEDLYFKPQKAIYLEAAKLESVFRTLVENKVEAIKNDKVRLASVNSSPKSLVRRMRITSSSSAASSKGNLYKNSPSPKHRRRRRAADDGELDYNYKKSKTDDTGKGDAQSPRLKKHRCYLRRHGDEETREIIKYLHCDSICSADDYINISAASYPCCSTEHTQITMPCSTDYVSLKMDGFEEIEEETIAYRSYLSKDKRRRHRRRRRRRKKHMRSHIEIASLPISEEVKEIDPDELPPRARWTIVVTACLLLFMCLLLVGITLRMAPIIDDMVRKENEEFMNSLHREPGQHNSHNLSPPIYK